MAAVSATEEPPSMFQLISDTDDHHQPLMLDHSTDDLNSTASFLLSAAAANFSREYDVIGDDEYEVATCYECVIVPVIFCIVIVSGCIGNLLVLVVVVRNREQFTSTTNLFIVNLAAADLFFLVFCVPFHAVIYTTSEGWPFGDALCKLVHFVQFASMTASVYTLVVMSLDRFLAVGYPLRTKHLRTPRYALIVAVAVWTTSALLASPWSVLYKVIEYQTIPVCSDDWSSVGRKHRATGYLVLFIVGFAIPLASIGVLSALTVRWLWATETTNDGPSRRRSVIAKRRVTRLIVVVVLVFGVCWLPSHVVWIWTNYFPSTWRHTYPFFCGRIAAHVLSYANSSMNPIIYAFLSSRFRREFQRAIRCRRPFRSGGSPYGTRFGGGGAGGGVTRSGSVVIGNGRDSTIGGGTNRDIAMTVNLATSADNGTAGVQRFGRCYHFQKGDASRTTSGLLSLSSRGVETDCRSRESVTRTTRNNVTCRHSNVLDEDDDVVVF